MQAFTDKAASAPEIKAQFELVEPEPGRREGRPTKLTPARFRRILEHIKSGTTITRSVMIEGVSYQCWRQHLQRKPDWQKLCDEAEEIREEVWRCEAMEALRSAFGKSWQSAAVFLERRWPHLWALRTVNRNLNSTDQVLDRISPEQMAQDAALALEVARQSPQLTGKSEENAAIFIKQNDPNA